ncbi:MAG: hypothetical protein Tp172MES00d2C118482111_22 [Prokaryotic dsDNA virus sp.]|nr:MAG: hypothetical protein Tp172MES00d2C118482111_22 [Prokaryotic dsDNA virus sp.]|tara:strand:- start:1286 stop:1504 length:219 start_codon:yes stop_codon:yes gene_type:complete
MAKKIKRYRVRTTITIEAAIDVFAASKDDAYKAAASHTHSNVKKLKPKLPGKLTQTKEASAYIYKSDVEILG